MKNKLKNLISISLIILSLISFSLANNEIPERTTLQEIKGILKTDYLYPDKLPLTGDSISGYIAALHDPYTQYFTPSEAKRLMEVLDNSISGIGVIMGKNPQGFPEINNVIKNSPAQKAGLQAGDLILAVNDIVFKKNQDFNLFISNIRGEVGTSTSLFIFRNGKILTLNVQRENIQIPIISSQKTNGICYLSLNNFDKGSANAFLQEMQSLGTCSEIIFDLRDNPGGIVEEVLKILETLLPTGTPLISLKTKNNQQTEYAQISNQHIPLPKTLILINKKTASASEIFAGVLKYYFPQKITLIGEKSFGKGSMQEVIPLKNTGVLKYTLALRHIANLSFSIDKIGLFPEISITDDPRTPQDEVLISLGLY